MKTIASLYTLRLLVAPKWRLRKRSSKRGSMTSSQTPRQTGRAMQSARGIHPIGYEWRIFYGGIPTPFLLIAKSGITGGRQGAIPASHDRDTHPRRWRASMEAKKLLTMTSWKIPDSSIHNLMNDMLSLVAFSYQRGMQLNRIFKTTSKIPQVIVTFTSYVNDSKEMTITNRLFYQY